MDIASLDESTRSLLLIIQEIVPENTFVVSVDMVKQIMRDTKQEIVEVARLLCIYLSMSSTVAPISHFSAGAVVIGSTGTMYIGFNIEYLQSPLSETIHAEQCAISNAVIHKEPKIEHIITIPTPCGHCRQFIRECTQAKDIMVHSCNNETGAFLFHLPLLEVLPYSFGPEDLGCTSGIMDVNGKKCIINARTLPSCEDNDKAIQYALENLPKSHSPHSKSWCSVVILWTQNEVKKFSTGVYLENAAYNPSLGALQCALVDLLIEKGSFSDICSVIVFEDNTAQVQHFTKTKLLLDIIAPSASVHLQNVQIS